MMKASSDMTPAVATTSEQHLPWIKIAWFGLILVIWFAPVLQPLVAQWSDDADMGHGFFVPVISAFIVWQERKELMEIGRAHV